MADNTVAAGEHGCYDQQLVADAVDHVTIEGRRAGEVEVWSDGTSAVYFRLDGIDPAVGDPGAWEIPAGAPAVRTVATPPGSEVIVALVSAGTPHYSVAHLEEQ